MVQEIKSNAQILVPANDNCGGRYIVVMKQEHIVFPDTLRERLLRVELRWPVPTAR